MVRVLDLESASYGSIEASTVARPARANKALLYLAGSLLVTAVVTVAVVMPATEPSEVELGMQTYEWQGVGEKAAEQDWADSPFNVEGEEHEWEGTLEAGQASDMANTGIEVESYEWSSLGQAAQADEIANAYDGPLEEHEWKGALEAGQSADIAGVVDNIMAENSNGY